MRTIHLIARIVVGLVFMFSGFVKGIDPLGMGYRLEDYFYAWGTLWMLPAALSLSVLLSTMEFVLGAVVLFNLKPKLNAWLLLGVMLFFTGLTFYDALYNPVPDCGCFGDAITLTNWQTFYKNVILMVPTLVLFFWRYKTADKYSNLVSYGSAAGLTALFVMLSIWCYRHLPIIDFMDWKTGNKMYVENPLPIKFYLTYKNKLTGETQEYLSPDYPFNDSVWMSQWEFVSQRTEDPNVFKGHDLQILDMEGNDYTDHFIQNPGYQFLLVSWGLDKANHDALVSINDFALKAEAEGHGFIALTSSLPEEIDSLRQQLNLNYEFYQADDITLKTMVRANPGLLLLHDGVVLDKWHYNDFPAYDEFLRKFQPTASQR
jgi:uncharacterized membrane protein YphA (DoxX/SURF4 family)